MRLTLLAQVFCAILLLLVGCSSTDLSPERKKSMNDFGIVSILGSEFHVDRVGTTLYQQKVQTFVVSEWNTNEKIRSLFSEELRAKEKKVLDINVDKSELSAALKKREDLMARLTGNPDDALNNLMLSSAADQGVKYVFLLSPIERQAEFPLHRGPMGLICYDRPLRKKMASPYFMFEVSLWDVTRRRKIFHTTATPLLTEDLSPIECKKLHHLSLARVVGNFQRYSDDAMQVVVKSIFKEMGW